MTNFIYENCGDAKVVFTSREGGVSIAPYESLNVGIHVGDNAESVLLNRKIVAENIGEQLIDKENWIFLNQTHCDEIFDVDHQVYNQVNPPVADASITQKSGQPLVAMVADCGPLVLASGKVLAIVHASAKTISLGLIAKTIEEMKIRSRSDRIDALLGPCIHPENYEYSDGDLNRLVEILGENARGTTKDGKPAFNLPKIIKTECEKAGAVFRDLGIDTFTNDEYFSYRRDGITGRQCVIAWL